MKQLALFVFLLSSYATSCHPIDTEKDTVWDRTEEPFLEGAQWRDCTRRPLGADRVVEDVQCVPARTTIEENCAPIENSPAEARRMLRSRKCTDAALEALKAFASEDPRVWSDVAAAYYIRAQRDDHASDLLRAFDAADRAVVAAPKDRGARFNLALIDEAVGLPEDAVANWKAYLALDQTSGWSGEARERLQRLERQIVRTGESRWTLCRKQLPGALRANDFPNIQELVKDFPRSALAYFETEVLPDGDPNGLLARALSARLGNDRYVLDVAAAAARNRAGHEAIRAARGIGLLEWQSSADAYAKAAGLLRRGGSPLDLEARIGRVLALSFDRDYAGDPADLMVPIEREVRARGYLYLLAWLQATRSSIRFRQSRYLESFADADEARALYERLDDGENLASIDRSTSGTYQLAGQTELAWRDGLLALRQLPHVVTRRIKQTVDGEVGNAVLALGYPRVAIRFHNAAVALYEKELRTTAPEAVDAITSGTYPLMAIALRSRAEAKLASGDVAGARSDLQRARPLASARDLDALRLLELRLAQAEARTLLKADPARAAAEFSSALEQLNPSEQRSSRAGLLSERAEAYRLAGRDAEAERDLRGALLELQKEEAQLLATRKPGEGESLWTTYFERFNDTYRRLIRSLADQGRGVEAFPYAERSHSLEPIDLILQRPIVPDGFRAIAANDDPLKAIQVALPNGTFLIQYFLTTDHACTWVISRDAIRFLDQEVTSGDVERWSEALQRAGRDRDIVTFAANLNAPFEKLIARPLAEISKMTGGRSPSRIVLIPDRVMYGLPFAALRDPANGQYLIQKFPIEIAASARLYVFSLMRSRDLSASEPSALLIGDPAFDTNLKFAQGLERLPGARAEVDEIRQFYEPDVDVRTGEQATVAEFLARARNKSIVHIAAHTVVNAVNPWRSLLLFAKTDRDHGVIEAQDLVSRLSLDRTRLVVLAACSSAGGLPVGSAGLAPLVRPLITAGVPAVVGSLWDVDDTTTKEVFVSFHRYYRQSGDAAAALWTAQNELLTTKRYDLRSVMAWAPFEVIGHTGPDATGASYGGTPCLHSSYGSSSRGCSHSSPMRITHSSTFSFSMSATGTSSPTEPLSRSTNPSFWRAADRAPATVRAATAPSPGISSTTRPAASRRTRSKPPSAAHGRSRDPISRCRKAARTIPTSQRSVSRPACGTASRRRRPPSGRITRGSRICIPSVRLAASMSKCSTPCRRRLSSPRAFVCAMDAFTRTRSRASAAM